MTGAPREVANRRATLPSMDLFQSAHESETDVRCRHQDSAISHPLLHPLNPHSPHRTSASDSSAPRSSVPLLPKINTTHSPFCVPLLQETYNLYHFIHRMMQGNFSTARQAAVNGYHLLWLDVSDTRDALASSQRKKSTRSRRASLRFQHVVLPSYHYQVRIRTGRRERVLRRVADMQAFAHRTQHNLPVIISHLAYLPRLRISTPIVIQSTLACSSSIGLCYICCYFYNYLKRVEGRHCMGGIS